MDVLNSCREQDHLCGPSISTFSGVKKDKSHLWIRGIWLHLLRSFSQIHRDELSLSGREKVPRHKGLNEKKREVRWEVVRGMRGDGERGWWRRDDVHSGRWESAEFSAGVDLKINLATIALLSYSACRGTVPGKRQNWGQAGRRRTREVKRGGERRRFLKKLH